MALFVKICGVTTAEDALVAVSAGADAIGVNLVAGSIRRVDVETARGIVEAVGGRVLTIAVVANLPVPQLTSLRESLGVDRLQLHGSESPADVVALTPVAFKAVRIGGLEDVQKARTYPGDPLLVDARVEGELGGTGRTFDWSLVKELGMERRILLAGGLHPENVARAVAEVSPWGVDVASGVETPEDPRRKHAELVLRFISTARSAAP